MIQLKCTQKELEELTKSGAIALMLNTVNEDINVTLLSEDTEEYVVVRESGRGTKHYKAKALCFEDALVALANHLPGYTYAAYNATTDEIIYGTDCCSCYGKVSSTIYHDKHHVKLYPNSLDSSAL